MPLYNSTFVEDGKCPDRFNPCSNKTTGSNSICNIGICYSQITSGLFCEKMDKCPIVDLKLTNTPEAYDRWESINFGN